MKKIARLFGLGFISLTALGSFTSCGKTGFKVGLLCLHGETSTYDVNFMDAFKEACKEEGLKEDEYVIRTNVSEDRNLCYTAAKEWAEDGFSLICADSFGHEIGLTQAAKEYPNTEFCHFTGVEGLNMNAAGYKNYHNAFASIYEGRYLAGVVAGCRIVEDLKKGVYKPNEALIGYVGAYQYAEVISGYTSFFLGAKAAIEDSEYKGKVDLKMKVKFTSSWYDFRAEKEAAESLIGKGCKLISQHADSMGAPSVCEDNRIPNVAYNINTSRTCPNTYLCASKINWKPYFKLAIQHAKDKYEGKSSTLAADFCGGITDKEETSSVQLCGFGNSVSQATKDKVKQIREHFIPDSLTGKKGLHVFDLDKFTVNGGETLDENYSPYGVTKKVVEEEDSKKYFNESFCVKNEPETQSIRSAPYFDVAIDDIEIV